MASEEEIKFKPEEIIDQMKNNIIPFLMFPIVYLSKKKLSVEEYAKFSGGIAARGWEGAKELPVKNVARQFALELATVGATKMSLSAGENDAELKVEGWPPKELLEFYGISQSELDPFWDVFKPIAEFLNLQFTWKREGDIVTLTLKK